MTVAENPLVPHEVRKIGKAEREQKGSARLRHGADGRLRGRRRHNVRRSAAAPIAWPGDVWYSKPELVLMDEPLGAVDSSCRAHAVRDSSTIPTISASLLSMSPRPGPRTLTMSDRSQSSKMDRIQAAGAADETLRTAGKTAFVAQFHRRKTTR